MCRRCSRAGTLPGCLFDQAAGALTKLHTVSRKKKKKKKNTQRQLDDMTVMKMATFFSVLFLQKFELRVVSQLLSTILCGLVGPVKCF